MLFLSLSVLGQNKTKDLTKLTYNELHDLYFDNENNPKKQILYTNAYMAKAIKENSRIRKAKANYQIALLYYASDKDKAIQYLDSVIKYSENTGDKFFPAAAYCEKADFLKRQLKLEEAMNNYKLAEKIALQTNIDYYYVVRDYIGTTKSEDLGEYKEALAIYKECYNYYVTKNYRKQYANDFQITIFGIADCYKSLQNTDSTTYYNKLGFQESKITKDGYMHYLFILNEGANQVLKKNYKAALDSVHKALPKMIENKDLGNTLASYFYLGKAYDGLGQKENAVKNFLKVDSIYAETKEITTEFIDGYPYLISHYKNIGDKENQLKYISKYMVIDSILQKKYRNLNKIVHTEYDIPRLISEKESLITSLKKDNAKSYLGIGALILIILTVSTFGFYQFELKKKYRTRFERIMQRSAIRNNEEHNFEKAKTIKPAILKTEDIGIAEELIQEILGKLDGFEREKGFLKSDLTIQSLSNLFETNSKYLSKIVNAYRCKTFIQYINDLRIDNAVENLKAESKLRKYTIQALALEFGFNSAESFSAAFYKKLGIKPAYFIKQLEDSFKIN
ncbi:AraC family transcriptional regulator [Flavobacterium sp. KJJ]|uniref:helix-turn-helix domain-containing protein n=1 Tax=Flavobacterium sp. KJJ TaxID=1270193 RepID=UPI000A5E5A70|nr:helix-turn-helix domain-containing protein [Flavobacterium sp. KJJ]